MVIASQANRKGNEGPLVKIISKTVTVYAKVLKTQDLKGLDKWVRGVLYCFRCC